MAIKQWLLLLSCIVHCVVSQRAESEVQGVATREDGKVGLRKLT